MGLLASLVKPDEFKYDASTSLKDNDRVTLTFALAKYADISKKLIINIKKINGG